nr:leucine-rich repeat serine/threonine-protein kinase 1-like [Oncorhynchus nerka]
MSFRHSSCGDANPLRDVFTVERPAGVTMATSPDLDSKRKSLDEEEEECPNDKVTLIYSEEAGTQIIQHQDSLTDYCSISSDSTPSLGFDRSGPLSEPLGLDRSSSCALSSLASSSSMPFSTEEEERPQDHPDDPDPVVNSDPTTTFTTTPPHLQALTVLAVNGSLWIPRSGGDVMVIEIQRQTGQLRGRVIAVLCPPGTSSYG